MARRHTYRREEPRCGTRPWPYQLTSVDVIVHRACCSTYPSYATSAAMDGTPSPGAPEKRAFSWCPLALRFSPGLDHQKTHAIINARLTGVGRSFLRERADNAPWLHAG